MHPSEHAKTTPDKPAIIMAETGEALTYGEFDALSNQGAQLFRAVGLRTGDVIALLMNNGPRFLEAAWAAQRSGLVFTCISTRSTAADVAYILRDSGAKLLICSAALEEVARSAANECSGVEVLVAGEVGAARRDFERLRAERPSTPIPDESAGIDLLYSSGTTGRPKGVKAKVPSGEPIGAPNRVADMARLRFGFDSDTIYLSPAPLYHAAPLRWCMAVHRLGGTVVMMEKFDAMAALRAIERYRISAAQWVPTHFVRLLKLEQAQREGFDLSSLKMAIHAAAPCPVAVKDGMLAWWRPVLHEYYAGTEGVGMTAIAPDEWLRKKGSVGRPVLGEVHVCDDAGEPLPHGMEGMVYFSGGATFEYLNDPEKTAGSYNKAGWATLGDVGYLDADGYLFLTDRKSFMIISGGVNIYPQEIENCLISHPQIADVAVIGAPDEEMGERVVAVVQPMRWEDRGEALAAEIMKYARGHLSHVKAPRQVDFQKELPRHENGKLYKRLIRDAYWSNARAG